MRSGRDTAPVIRSELVYAQDYVVGLDYAIFHLYTGEPDPDRDGSLLDDARDGIAQAGNAVVVTSPHQNNFEMPLRVETWTGEPVSDLAEWQEAFEVRLDVGESGLMFASPTMDPVSLGVPAGAYHVLITGRGFVEDGWPGSTEPGDQWRFRFWPTNDHISPRRLKRWTPAPRSQDRIAAERAARRRERQRPRRQFDMSDPERIDLIARTAQITTPPLNDYADVDNALDPATGILNMRIMFQLVPSQLMLVLTGPEIDSVDPHEYLRRARASIAQILGRTADQRAEPLRQLDALIEDTLQFDAADIQFAASSHRRIVYGL